MIIGKKNVASLGRVEEIARTIEQAPRGICKFGLDYEDTMRREDLGRLMKALSTRHADSLRILTLCISFGRKMG